MDLSDIDLAGTVEKVEERPVAQGGFSDIYLGSWTKSPPAEKIQVAIKVIVTRCLDEDTDTRIERRLNREISTWRNLDHPGIIKLYGISSEFGKFPALISPWYSNGDATTYLKAHPDANRLKLLRGAVAAVQHLHGLQPAVVHGDIKAANVLVKDDGEACLGDFGLSRFIQHVSTGLTTTTPSSGTPRWMAPELLFGNGGDLAPVTKEGDVYALGCLALELTTDEWPWYSIHNNAEFMVKVHEGHLPPRPENEVAARELSDGLWALITSCWSREPPERPQVTTVHSRLLSMSGAKLAGIPMIGTELPSSLAAGAPILQEIIAAFTRVQFHREQYQVLRDRSEECFQTINSSWKPEDEPTLAPMAKKFIELLTEIRSSMETYASYGDAESLVQQFNITTDLEAKLNRLDRTLAEFGVAHAPLRPHCLQSPTPVSGPLPVAIKEEEEEYEHEDEPYDHEDELYDPDDELYDHGDEPDDYEGELYDYDNEEGREEYEYEEGLDDYDNEM
ncbi:hypothetical protein BOTBODRAFT_35832 [Botryobasidium botryosum FD-172 SS1]|uniref:Protein kinase domain-containing protein n=1 Tax=Botryobasidium botryosum (strain FD-172 SS1) TaxID=930990 RepID=A0A067M551_BOTB1|nr:hypothetical protein BOTBODRAFT_35832 [Botryobasidium botryosum FD-172 SS1]